ncbi:iron chaperone [Deinococcus pimensis]|uniref:iron chaperone n=1 Tax=Deinococcus pimensis TaxID=309888 RepID=UPI00048349C2|nr:DUF1801 domain-containing protein [Deinococcus pimensis]
MTQTKRRQTRGEAPSFTVEEREAMKERARETRRAARGPGVDVEAEVLAKIAEMSEADRALAARLHELVREAAPSLSAKLWYGMPAYARGGKVVCFFQAAGKFRTRYATLGFSDEATLDDGHLWPTSFALKVFTPEVEAEVRALLGRAVGS